ncbi:hypothetical protein STEG23_007221, partial [Scotinomys teguina]
LGICSENVIGENSCEWNQGPADSGGLKLFLFSRALVVLKMIGKLNIMTPDVKFLIKILIMKGESVLKPSIHTYCYELS